VPKPKLPYKKFIWTSKLAYAIGLITTDGSLSKDGRHIIFTSSDRKLLETFRKCLEIQNKITNNPPSTISKKPAYRIQFGNVRLYKWLVKIGLSPNKTQKLGELKIPSKFFPDFLRGHLDGDGSVITYIDRYNTYKNPKYVYIRLMTYFMSARGEHIRWLQKKTIKLAGVKGAILKRQFPTLKNKKTIYTLKFSKKESIRLLNWIYYQPNLPCLERKYQIALPFLKGH